MTIKASSQITISKVIDIYACYRYYKLQGSTLAKPTKPTKNPPDGWSDTEPAYISGSTNTLYFVDCNVYSDKTFSFSEVSKSSSYEAAKDAWNKANKAQDTATNAQNKVDNLQIGGRNLKLNGDFKKGLTAYGTEGDVNVSIENDVTYTKCAKVVFSTAYASERLYTTDYNNRYNLLNTVYTLSFVAKASSNLKLNVYRAGTAQGIGETNLSTEWKKFEMTYTATGTGSVTFKLNSAGTLYLANIKLELGNKATDWTPAPEDGIAKVDVEYYLSTSSTSLAGGSWTTTYPGWVNGKYIWTRSVITYTSGNTVTTTSICVTGQKGDTGPKGDKGNTGAQGPQGAAGKSIGSVVNYYLATNASSGVTTSATGWTTNVQSVTATNKYLWNYEVIKYTDGSVASTTTPCIIGAYGDKGATGPKGDKGTTGATGKGIKSVTEHYAVSASNSTAPTSWSTTVPTMTSTNRYLWNYETIAYTDNSTSDTTKRVIGVYGDKGNTGPQGVKGDKGNTGPQGPKGDKGDKGNIGATGAAGKGVKSTAITYQASTSGVVTPTGTWSTTIPAVSAGSYLWTRTIITYTDNNTSTSYSVGKMGNTGAQGPKGDTGAQGPKGDKGNTGATGAAGKGIKSTAVTYQAGMTGVAVPTGTWSTTIPSTSASKPFLWSRTIITYTDNTTSTTYSVGSTADSVQVGGRNLIHNSKGNQADGFFKYFNVNTGESYGEISMKSTNDYPSVNLDKAFVVSIRDYPVGETYTWSYDIMYTAWNFPSGTSVGELWMGQRYTIPPSGQTGTGSWRNVTTHGLPMVGSGGCKLNEWYHVVRKVVIPEKASNNIGYQQCIQFHGTNANIECGFTARFRNVKLEKGNIATDWTPAPEDLIKSITEANTAIEKTDEKISMKASVDSVTEISNRANEIEGMLSEAKTTIARHEESIQMLTSDEFTVKFTNVVQQITSVDGKFEQYKEKMDNWLRFDKNGNLIIGSTRVPGQPAYEIMIGKNRISFLLNDIEVAYISDDEMHINKSTVMESITIGRENQKFIWEMRGNGNLGLVWR